MSKDSNGDKAIVFLHIPKTAGTTLHRIIERQYAPKEMYSVGLTDGHSVAQLQQIDKGKRARIRMFRGHMGFGVHKHLPGPSTYFTVLRDPVDRVISYYYFIRRTPSHYLHDFIRDDEVDLKSFIESEAHVMIDNAQTRVISGVWHGPKFGQCTREMLGMAKRNLRDHFAVIGLTERFNETLLLLSKTFGWRWLFYTRKNVSRRRPRKEELSIDTLKAVTSSNRLDIELYDFAENLFEQQIRSQSSAFYRDVRLFETANHMVDVLMKVYWELRKVSVRTMIRSWTRQWHRQ